MKIIKITIPFLLLFAFTARAQVLISLIFGEALNTGKIEFGLVGGYNWFQISGLEKNEPAGAYNLGFYFDVRLSKPWYLYTGVMVKSNLGSGGLTENDLRQIGYSASFENAGSYGQFTKTFMVPFQLKIRFENNIFFQAGIQAGLLYDAWIEYNDSADNFEVEKRYYNKDYLNKLDFGVLLGGGYKLKEKNDNGMSFLLQYYYGILDAYKDVAGSNYSSLFLELTVPIGAD